MRKAGRDYVLQRIGSMFCLYFTSAEVHNLTDAQRSDREAFGRFFHACLESGVYFAPSQFEAGFLSLAHSSMDFGLTAEAVAKALA